MTFQDWQKRGQYHSIFNRQVFVIDEGEAEDTLVVLHGYPTCSYDYWKVLPILTKRFRVIIHDHLGFGLSDKPKNYSYSLIEQADVAIQLWKQLDLKKIHLLAHDYGTSVATEIIARRNMGYEPIEIKSATIGNGSMLIEMAKLLPIQKILRHKFWGPIVANMISESIFKRNMRKIWADRSKIEEEELTVLWQMLEFKDTFSVMHEISTYTKERAFFWNRWIGGLAKTDLPINLLWADKDPVAIIEMAHVLHKKIPNNRLKILPNLGHYLMLEDADLYAKSVIEMIDNLPNWSA